MDWMSMSPQNSYAEILTSHLMVLGGAAFGRWLSDESRAPVNGVSALIKGTLESSLAPSTISRHREDWLWTRKWAFPRYWLCWFLDLGRPSLWDYEEWVFVVSASQARVFCYSSPNGLRWKEVCQVQYLGQTCCELCLSAKCAPIPAPGACE